MPPPSKDFNDFCVHRLKVVNFFVSAITDVKNTGHADTPSSHFLITMVESRGWVIVSLYNKLFWVIDLITYIFDEEVQVTTFQFQ